MLALRLSEKSKVQGAGGLLGTSGRGREYNAQREFTPYTAPSAGVKRPLAGVADTEQAAVCTKVVCPSSIRTRKSFAIERSSLSLS